MSSSLQSEWEESESAPKTFFSSLAPELHTPCVTGRAR